MRSLRTAFVELPAVFWPVAAGCNLLVADQASQRSDSPKSPLSPAAAVKHFVVHPELKIELVACEPQVVDPVAIAFDEDGRLWVVEMRECDPRSSYRSVSISIDNSNR